LAFPTKQFEINKPLERLPTTPFKQKQKTLRSDRFNNRVIEKLIFQAVKPLRKRFTKSLNS
jgi:hypothetical protein